VLNTPKRGKKMDSKTQTEMQAVIESTPGVHKVSDAWYVGRKKYIYFATRNGFPLQYDMKRIGTAKTVAEIKAFIAADYAADWLSALFD
jgi:Tfp pilus assembly protein PilP